MNKIKKQTNNSKASCIDKETIEILNKAENIIQSLNQEKPIKKHKKIYLFIFFIIFFIILIGVFCTIFALININNNNILNNIYINDINISNLSKEDAKNLLNNKINEQLKKEIKITHLNFNGVIFAEHINLSYDTDKIIDDAYQYCRNDNIFYNNFKILKLYFKPKTFNLEMNYDNDLLEAIINNINPLLPDKVINPDFYIDENTNNLIITAGQNGVIVDNTSFKTILLNTLSNLNLDTLSFNIPITNKNCKEINIDNIYKEIYKPAVDASFNSNPYSFTPSTNGLDFNISLEEAKSLLTTKQLEYTIPLKILYPSVYTNDIGLEAFPDLLSSYSTTFYSSNYSRSTNIQLAAKKMNGKVLLPGETFSFNQVVGQRTKAAGFKEAPAYLNGKVIQDYGGGICQVSSTLYNAVLYSNLDIIERTNHGYKPSYVPAGLDATVSWGGPDFKFKNNRNYPIKIITNTYGKKLDIYIYGLKSSSDYKVKLEAKYIRNVPFKTIYQKNNSLSHGQSRVIKYGANGCKTATYKYLYDQNNNFISSECISRDTYNPHNKIVEVGR